MRWDFSFVPQVIEDLLNHLRVFDAGDDVHGCTNSAGAGDCIHAVVGIPFQKTLPLQVPANAARDGMRQLGKLGIGGRLDLAEPG